MRQLNMPVALPDVLVADGKWVYMRSQQFDLEGNRLAIETPTRQAKEQKGETAHLFCPTGLLDDVWWHRSYWVFGRVWVSGAAGYFQAGQFAPAGRPMVFDEKNVYSFGRMPRYYRWTTPMEYILYAAARRPQIEPLGGKGQPARAKSAWRSCVTVAKVWKRQLPLLTRAMVLAGDTLFVAGPPDLCDEVHTWKTFVRPETQKLLARQAAALKGAEGALLVAVSAADGKKLAERKLDSPPVFDGLVAAGGKLYFSSVDGRVFCLKGK
jgi:hypothetical protein